VDDRNLSAFDQNGRGGFNSIGPQRIFARFNKLQEPTADVDKLTIKCKAILFGKIIQWRQTQNRSRLFLPKEEKYVKIDCRYRFGMQNGGEGSTDRIFVNYPFTAHRLESVDYRAQAARRRIAFHITTILISAK